MLAFSLYVAPMASQQTSDIKNIFIIAIDTLRHDYRGFNNYPKSTSPYIDKFAAKSLSFTNAYTVCSWTAPSFASLFTSRLPVQHQVLKFPDPKSMLSQITTCTELLKQRGFQTGCFTGGGYVSRNWGFLKGFQQFSSQGRLFKDNLDECISFINKNKSSKQFIFLHGFDCHRPYEPEPRFDVFLDDNTSDYDVSTLYMPESILPQTQEDVEKIKGKYAGCVKMADHYVGKFLEELEELGLLENSIVVLMSDHGEEFLEHGCFDHVRTLYEELVRIPLILYFPGCHPSESHETVSLVDIAPTILGFLNISMEPSEGVSLLQPSQSRVIYIETGYNEDYLEATRNRNYHKDRSLLLRAVIKTNNKLILDEHLEPVEFYELTTDPNEQTNRIAAVNTEELHHLAHKKFGDATSRDFEYQKNIVKIEESLKQRLRSLGYF